MSFSLYSFKMLLMPSSPPPSLSLSNTCMASLNHTHGSFSFLCCGFAVLSLNNLALPPYLPHSYILLLSLPCFSTADGQREMRWYRLDGYILNTVLFAFLNVVFLLINIRKNVLLTFSGVFFIIDRRIIRFLDSRVHTFCTWRRVSRHEWHECSLGLTWHKVSSWMTGVIFPFGNMAKKKEQIAQF